MPVHIVRGIHLFITVHHNHIIPVTVCENILHNIVRLVAVKLCRIVPNSFIVTSVVFVLIVPQSLKNLHYLLVVNDVIVFSTARVDKQ